MKDEHHPNPSVVRSDVRLAELLCPDNGMMIIARAESVAFEAKSLSDTEDLNARRIAQAMVAISKHIAFMAQITGKTVEEWQARIEAHATELARVPFDEHSTWATQAKPSEGR
jgi:hypothetical protein